MSVSERVRKFVESHNAPFRFQGNVLSKIKEEQGRTVYRVKSGSMNRHIVKLAKNQTGKTENKNEIMNWREAKSNGCSDLFVPPVDYCDEYSWIVMQPAKQGSIPLSERKNLRREIQNELPGVGVKELLPQDVGYNMSKVKAVNYNW